MQNYSKRRSHGLRLLEYSFECYIAFFGFIAFVLFSRARRGPMGIVRHYLRVLSLPEFAGVQPLHPMRVFSCLRAVFLGRKAFEPILGGAGGQSTTLKWVIRKIAYQSPSDWSVLRSLLLSFLDQSPPVITSSKPRLTSAADVLPLTAFLLHSKCFPPVARRLL